MPSTTDASLIEQAAAFRAGSAAAVPGRLGALLADRVARLHGDSSAPRPPDDLTEAEAAAIEVAEQFVVDVHGLTDESVERLRSHLSDAEIVAVMFHLACLDGFGKLDVVHPSAHRPAPRPAPADAAGASTTPTPATEDPT